MLIETIYLDLADTSMFYFGYNITMNIFCIHIDIFKTPKWEEKITKLWRMVLKQVEKKPTFVPALEGAPFKEMSSNCTQHSSFCEIDCQH